MPAGVDAPSIAVNTLRPKKNGIPQSKSPALGPAKSLNTKSPGVENRLSAFATLKLTVAEALFVPVIVAGRFSVAEGQ